MTNFFMGLVTGLLGLVVWGAFAELGSEKDPATYKLMVLGFVLMIAGPILFWIIRPLWTRLRQK